MMKLEFDVEEIRNKLHKQKTEEINIMEFIIVLSTIISKEEQRVFTEKMSKITCPEDKFALIEEYRHYLIPDNQLN
jgi:hypothetical protein